jgi:hypothetical protein
MMVGHGAGLKGFLLVKKSLKFFVKVLAAVDQMYDNELVRMIECVGDPALRLALGKVKRVQHVE